MAEINLFNAMNAAKAHYTIKYLFKYIITLDKRPYK